MTYQGDSYPAELKFQTDPLPAVSFLALLKYFDMVLRLNQMNARWWNERLLACRGQEQAALHEKAGTVRNKMFGKKVFVRAVLEISNYCRQNCRYCAMRRDNRSLERLRLPLDLLRRIVLESLPSSVTDINIQAGEDPVAVREIVLPLIQEIKRETNLGIGVCLGTLDYELYDELLEAGANYYIIKIETGSAEHYQKMRAPGSLEKRLAAIQHLTQTGWHVSSGIIAGLPLQTPAMLTESLKLLSSLPLAGASISPFIPGSDTPYAHAEAGNIETTLNCVALLRLANPRYIIPAVSAMNLLGSDGYVRALRAGANLATINLTPREWREHYPIYKKDRWIMHEERVMRAIEDADCAVSETSLTRSLQERLLAPLRK
ncbi:MAG: radical SAM protein [bacterium]